MKQSIVSVTVGLLNVCALS